VHFAAPLPQILFCALVQECLDKVLKVCKARGVIPGNYAFPADKAGPLLSAGYPFVASGNDLQLLLTAAAQDLKGLEVQPIGYSWSYSALRIGHWVPIWQAMYRLTAHPAEACHCVKPCG
jgi:hypothetical protein